MQFVFILLSVLNIVYGKLWRHGIVHYTINNKDYDAHSQDIIVTTMSQLQEEICVKFFQLSTYSNNTIDGKILYISNPHKRKTCSTNVYDFRKTVVDMPIGYKCLNQADIARIVTEMLRASIDPTGPSVNSYDLIKRFEEKDLNNPSSTLITSSDRNYINFHYKTECGLASLPRPILQRRIPMDSNQIGRNSGHHYLSKLWPLAVVWYGIDKNLTNSADFDNLKNAMNTIELASCVVFQKVILDDVLLPKSFIWFTDEGHDMPKLGYTEGKQTLKLSSITNGAPGHTAHTLNNLMRILGIYMMSNRYDRQNHVIINWRNVESGKEEYLERAPYLAWIYEIPYDFDSVTHAPANYMCRNCDLGSYTVQPIQDHLWQRTLSMGHKRELSKYDIQIINWLYNKECGRRYMSDNKLTK